MYRLISEFMPAKEKFDGYIIKGKVKGIEQAWVKLSRIDYTKRSNRIIPIDSVQLVNGTFEFKGKVDYVDQVSIQFGDKYYSDFILENCSIKLDVLASLNERGRGEVEMKVSGSKLNDMLAVQNAKEDRHFHQEKYAIFTELRAEMEKAYSSKDETKIKKYIKRFSKYQALSDERYAERKSLR